MADKQISGSLWKRHGYCKPICILIFLHRSLWPNCINSSRVSIHSHCFFLSMAARLSGLDEHKPGTNIQKEGHTLTPPSSQNGPEDPEAFGSTPSRSPSRKPNCPETWYCLEIQVISTEDKRAVPPPSHAWHLPIVKEMVQDGKAGLTEAVVIGPVGQSCSMGDSH